MTITQFLALFPYAKPTKKGWDVCCPAHDDHSPSLGIMEGDGGRIVLNCFAGCTPGAICAALQIELVDLFADRPLPGQVRPLSLPLKKYSRVKLAFAYELHALDLKLQAEKILSVASHCTDCDAWTNDDRELAMQAVSRAYAYQERAQFCESYADHLREDDHELKRSASRQPSTGGAST